MMTVVAISKIYRRWKYDVSRVELELLSLATLGRCVLEIYLKVMFLILTEEEIHRDNHRYWRGKNKIIFLGSILLK